MTNLERFEKTVYHEHVDRLLTYDFVDNKDLLVTYGGYDFSKEYGFEELLEANLRSFKEMGLDVTRYIYDPVNHWMGAKIENWKRFFKIDPSAWGVDQTGGTAWISKRPFTDLKGLEKHMPEEPLYEEVEEWYKPFIHYMKQMFDSYDLVFIGAVEGPITDTYSYMDMELFAQAIYEAPELVEHIMNCTGKFSAYTAQVFAENASAPVQFMGEDISGSTGPIFSPAFVREQGLPRWQWIKEPGGNHGVKFLFHTDGRYGEFLPLIFDEFKADGLNPIERNGCNDIFDIHARYPDKLLFGNVCCEITLPHGNVYDVEDETLELIEKIGVDGGIFIGSSSEVHDLVPMENALTMYQTVHEYGEFPIDVERVQRRRKEIEPKLHTRKYVEV
jgi:hypothetical protein